MADRVLILGAGPIGILLSMAIRLQGAAEIIQVDKNEARLELARECGATKVFSSIDELEKDSYDVVVEASGSAFLLEKTMDFVRYGGTILWFGVPKPDVKIPLNAFKFFEKGLYLLSSYTSVRNSIQAVRLLESGKIDVSKLVSHQLPLSAFEQGVSAIENGTDNVLKVMLMPEL
jgi:threonine dehydrogenase-like Zn-dependent dehydrogenase